MSRNKIKSTITQEQFLCNYTTSFYYQYLQLTVA
uniref:Uncharacterized protein n=1 Tax=Anguilla anguilla TaxID=7936 RepID=A0A0E9Q2T6_ANGAN